VERDDMGDIIQEREQFAISPDAALIEWNVTQSPIAKRLLQLAGGRNRTAVRSFKESAAFRAVVENLFDSEMRSAGFINAA
jgi:hypothetical protein